MKGRGLGERDREGQNLSVTRMMDTVGMVTKDRVKGRA